MTRVEQLQISGSLPSPKGVALAVMEICRREDATVAEVAKVVQTDPALTGRLIKQANSAAHAGRPIASVPDAIMRLGMNIVRSLAMGFSLVDQYHDGPCKAFDYQRFWSHSLLMALAMQEFGGQSRVGAGDELFACGLLARIGSLALATAYPVEYASILEDKDTISTLAERERLRLQTDHNELSAALLTDWGIPHILVEPVLFHEEPERSGFSPGSRPYTLVNLLFMASRLADLALAQESERNRLSAELMLLGGKFGLDTDAFGNMTDNVIKQWREWGVLLKVPAASLPTFTRMAASPAPKLGEQPDAASLRILLVEDDATTRLLLENLLAKSWGHSVYSAVDGQQALALAIEVRPQVVVTDWIMPVMDGIEFCHALRATDWGRSFYVVMLTGVEDEDRLVEAFDAGVDDYVNKPVNPRALRARLRAAWHYVKLQEEWERDRAQLKQFATELAVSNRKLEHAAMSDLLTGLPNRRAAMNYLSQAWSAASRSNQPMNVMVIDIDRFKSINDTHGHAVGDTTLREVAKAIRATARKEDNVCHIGGEEFLVICQGADIKATLQSAERLRHTVRELRIKVGDGVIQLTISIGVAGKEPDMPDMDAQVRAADKALYAAKHAGRDRTCLTSQGQVHCGNP